MYVSDMEETYEEYKDWRQEEEPDSFTKQTYHKALAKLEKVKPYEDNLVCPLLKEEVG